MSECWRIDFQSNKEVQYEENENTKSDEDCVT